MFKRYIDYLKDNPEGYWFKAKLFGWGWTPVTWQGWLVTLVYVLLIVLLGSTLDESSTDREAMLVFVLPVIMLTAAFIRIAYKKGEKPSWNWGFPKNRNKSSDEEK